MNHSRSTKSIDILESNSLEYAKNLNSLNTSVANVNLESDKVILTTDDVIRLENGMEPQIYDAYILYAEEDVNFATEIIETMESKYNLKVFDNNNNNNNDKCICIYLHLFIIIITITF